MTVDDRAIPFFISLLQEVGILYRINSTAPTSTLCIIRGGGRGGTHLILTPTIYSEKLIQFAPRHNRSAFRLFLPVSSCVPMLPSVRQKLACFFSVHWRDAVKRIRLDILTMQ